ncbi:MAG TPA: hypothetical protein VM364_00685 [Vicinamibacterales bacterium]|nr:hypothetical protein [Vicinamibacterales bacterium]
MAFWITFEDGKRGSIEVRQGEDPRAIAATFGVVKTIDPLPYPATPQLRSVTGCPPFCYSPQTCKGRTSCPKSYACSE